LVVFAVLMTILLMLPKPLGLQFLQIVSTLLI
jgi:hypothetical protein